MELKLIQDIHKSTKRDYAGRMNDDKVNCALKAREFGIEFWDGDRKFGYGGYKNDGRWRSIADKLIGKYQLTKKSIVLDIGCGKGFLAREIIDMCGAQVWGCDISRYALENGALEGYFEFRAGKDELRGDYELIISINTLHNLILPDLKQALEQISAHSRNSYIVVESYRSVQELHNLQCWNLTGEQFLRPEEWKFLFNEWGYSGDFEFIYFE